MLVKIWNINFEFFENMLFDLDFMKFDFVFISLRVITFCRIFVKRLCDKPPNSDKSIEKFAEYLKTLKNQGGNFVYKAIIQ